MSDQPVQAGQFAELDSHRLREETPGFTDVLGATAPFKQIVYVLEIRDTEVCVQQSNIAVMWVKLDWLKSFEPEVAHDR